MIERATVVGLGLMGGSFALALKSAHPSLVVTGVDRRSVIDRALERGVIDRGETDVAHGVEGADFVMLATPISVIVEHLGARGAPWRAGALVTDVGSTKRRILEAASALPAEVAFIGGHPMAGKAASGLEVAETGLFRGAPWCLVPRPGSDTDALERLAELVRAVGARPVVMDAESHDRAVAVVSHVPQILSLLVTQQAAGVERALDIGGPAFREFARLAGSPFSTWRDIFETNEDMTRDALVTLAKLLDETERALPRLETYFDRAREALQKPREPLC